MPFICFAFFSTFVFLRRMKKSHTESPQVAETDDDTSFVSRWWDEPCTTTQLKSNGGIIIAPQKRPYPFKLDEQNTSFT